MDIKIRFTKKSILIVGGVILCGIIAFGYWNNSATKARHDVKATCQVNCDCFNNVVDYRLTNERVKLFARFMKELQVRRDATVLEFMDTMDAVAIQKAFAACQPSAEPAPAPEPSESTVQAKNKKK